MEARSEYVAFLQRTASTKSEHALKCLYIGAIANWLALASKVRIRTSAILIVMKRLWVPEKLSGITLSSDHWYTAPYPGL